jgi:Ser/Thr protein kinase RdoA (MazF antagonist)
MFLLTVLLQKEIRKKYVIILIRIAELESLAHNFNFFVHTRDRWCFAMKIIFFKISTSEQHTATDLVNLLYFLRPVSSDHTDFVREFEQDG